MSLTLTNGAGQDVAHYRYDAFGNTLEAAGTRAGENPYRFSTKPIHQRSGGIVASHRVRFGRRGCIAGGHLFQ